MEGINDIKKIIDNVNVIAKITSCIQCPMNNLCDIVRGHNFIMHVLVRKCAKIVWKYLDENKFNLPPSYSLVNNNILSFYSAIYSSKGTHCLPYKMDEIKF